MITCLRYLLVLNICILGINANAQVATTYNFYQSLENYAPGTSAGTPASVFPVAFDDESVTYTSPFTFIYNGTTYTAGTGRIGVSANGWIALGTNAGFTMSGLGAGGSYINASSNGSYLSGTSNNNGIAGFNGNLAYQAFANFTCNFTAASSVLSNVPAAAFANLQVGTRLTATSYITPGTVVLGLNSIAGTVTLSQAALLTGTSISVTPGSSIIGYLTGTTPNQTLVIQYTQLSRQGVTGDNFNFQIVISENGNIQVKYGKCITTATSFEVQSGLRGSSSADFNARKTTSDWANTSAATTNADRLLLSSTIFPASGTVFNWTTGPLPVNNNCATATSITPNATCVATTGTTVNSNQQFTPTTCGGFTATFANDVWYSFTANGTSFYSISTTGTNGFDPVIGLYSACNTGSFISCSDASLSNGTETINAGILPPGTYYYRIYGWNGSTGTFTTCVQFGVPCNTPTATATNLILTPSTASVAGSFSAASPAPSGYLVIRTNSITPPTTPVNGTAYTPGSTALGGYIESFSNSLTFTSTALEPLTQYCYWVYSYNNTGCLGGPLYRTTYLLGCSTTTACGAITTKTWANGGAGGDFNTASNWTPAGVPTACNDVIINMTASGTISLSASATVRSITASVTGNGQPRSCVIDVLDKNLTVLTSTNIDASGGTSNTFSFGSSTSGNLELIGNVILGTSASTGNPSTSVGSGLIGTSATKFTFRGNLTMGLTSFIATTPPGTAVFDAPTTQTITWNNTVFYANFNNVIIGNENDPVFNQVTGTITPDNIKGDLTINGNSVLNMGTSQWNRNSVGGVLRLNDNSSLKLAGTASVSIGGNSPGGVAVTGNNFPAGFATCLLSPTSTVEYNSGNGVAQFIAPLTFVPVTTYGNLVLTNSTGSGSSIKTMTQDLTGIAGNLTINPYATFDITTFKANRSTVGGTFTNNANSIFRLSGSTGGAGLNNNFPSNFSTYSFDAASFTEYYGTTQGIYATPVYGHLTLSTAGTKTAPSGDLTIKGNFVNNGSTFAHNNGRVILNGTGAQTFAGVNYYNLLLAAGTIKTTVGKVSITDSLKLNSPVNLSISANDTITIVSSSGKTGSVASIPAGATISYGTNAKFRVERYIPNHPKAWQFIAVPAIGQTVKAAWQEGAVTANGNPNPGYGTQLTSMLPTALALGFDVYSPTANSIKTYNPATDSWDGIASTSINLYNKKGYMLFVRGDRSVIASAQAATATTLRTAGTIYDAVTTPPVTSIAAGKFESIGNPFASAIDPDKISLTGGVARNFYVWDPKLTTVGVSAWGLGAFQTLSSNFPSPGYTIVPGGGSYTGGNTNLESGQAFFMLAPFTTGTVSFNENAKTVGSNMVYRNGTIRNIKTNLLTNVNQQPVLLDGVMNQFDDIYSNQIDISDAQKINNNGEMLSITRENKEFVLERRSSIIEKDTIFYAISGLRNRQNYFFEIAGEDMMIPGMELFLEDKYLHTQTLLDFTQTNRYVFSTDENPLSYDRKRFMLIINPARPLPVTFTDISGDRLSEKTIAVHWKVASESNVSEYIVEKSMTGNQFQPVGTVIPINNNYGNAVYDFTDRNATASLTWYRIQAKFADGNKAYSAIVKVVSGKIISKIEVFPNPVTDGKLNLSFTKMKGNYQLQLINDAGQMVFDSKFNVENQFEVKSFLLNNNISTAYYNCMITNSKGEVIKIRVFKN